MEVDLCMQPFLNVPGTRLVGRLGQIYWNFIKTHLEVVQSQKQQCILRTEMFPGLQE